MQLRSFFTALLVVLVATSFASADWQLIHHYTLDESTGTTAYDSAGSLNGTLTNVGGTTGSFTFDADSVTGTIGDALNFTGSNNDIISLGDSGLALGTEEFIISMWVKRASISTTTDGNERQGLFGQQSLDTLNAHSMWARFDSSTNLLHFVIDKGEAVDSLDVLSNTAITDTTAWHLLEFERTYSSVNDETTYAIYIDGTLEGSTVDAGTPYDICGDDGAAFGSYTPTTTRSFDGIMDDVKVYTQAVPEPSTMFLLTFGLLGLLGFRRR